ncbi:hypothetical protein [Agromyces binzhouensis]|uniref:Uncharacterized protein n=1 Tax=Agromyces binzhouensis TaxID=1817495 RepID=A0A4Q2JU88_9MICO|nr:hypothetical protein [Agromyces binzhouensis]RXZ51905.1 hypothetical protein ESO86_00160 [Agromyces binzhouensis]
MQGPEFAEQSAASAPDSPSSSHVRRGVLLPPARAGIVETKGNGYDFIAANERAGWRAVPDWGRNGWDLGRWPTAIVMASDEHRRPRALVYLEGDLEAREFDTADERTRFVDDVAEELWRAGEADGPRDVAAYPAGELPPEYRGPVPRAQGSPAAGTVGPSTTSVPSVHEAPSTARSVGRR